MYAAWLPDSRADAWLDRAVPELSAQRRKECRQALALVRDRGYSVTVRGPSGGGATREALPDDLADNGAKVLGIGAPSFGAGGALECAVALVDPAVAGGAPSAEALARKVTAAADRLSRALGGALS